MRRRLALLPLTRSCYVFGSLKSAWKDEFKMIQATVRVAVLSLVAGSTAFGFQAKSGDWPWWRGPNNNGIAEAGQDVPTSWSETKNVLWKVPVPGRGHSSPTVIGDRIFLATADERNQIQYVMAYNRENGKELWRTPVSRGGFPNTHPKNTHGTCTVACDGERLFVAFHHHAKVTLACLNLDGKEQWRKDCGKFDPRMYEYGYAPSPVIYKSMVILSADYEGGGYIAAYDRESGERAWKTKRPSGRQTGLSFSSPIVANVAGKDQLLLSGCQQVASYDPSTGKLNWNVPGATTMATCGTVVWDGDLIFASGGYPKPETVCIKADGSRKVVWRNRQKCYEQSMLAYKGYVYAVTDQGIAYCWRATDGKEMWRSRLKGPISASPILVGDNIYQSIENGRTYVFKATPDRFTAVAENQLGNSAFATPSICGNRIYLRVAKGGRGSRQEYLYAIGKN